MESFLKAITNLAGRVGQWLQTDTAVYVYSWLAIAAVLFVSLWLAIHLIRKVREFNIKALVWQPPGQNPRAKKSIEKRILKLGDIASARFNQIARHTLGLVFVGIVIPGALLGLIAAEQHWFLPGGVALTLEGVPINSSDLSNFDLLMFVADQSFRGSLSDTFEVFGFALTQVQNNPNNWVFSAFVLFYRFLSGVVFLAVLFVIFRIALAALEAKNNIQLWKKELEELSASEQPVTTS
ncbi:MAG: hypothetical protein L3J04_00435 [Robiginitomaculum sp.]|nr:hypothetical protein [Robiginitomaculum sp.]